MIGIFEHILCFNLCLAVPKDNSKYLVPFKKGEDERRNMKGRPKKLPDLEKLLIELLSEEAKEGDGRPAAKVILEALRLKAAKGDVKAIDLLLSRAYGKAKETINQTITQYNVEVTKEEAKNINDALESKF